MHKHVEGFPPCIHTPAADLSLYWVACLSQIVRAEVSEAYTDSVSSMTKWVQFVSRNSGCAACNLDGDMIFHTLSSRLAAQWLHCYTIPTTWNSVQIILEEFCPRMSYVMFVPTLSHDLHTDLTSQEQSWYCRSTCPVSYRDCSQLLLGILWLRMMTTCLWIQVSNQKQKWLPISRQDRSSAWNTKPHQSRQDTVDMQ